MKYSRTILAMSMPRTANVEAPQVTDEDHAAADATTICSTPCRVPGAERRT